MSSKIERVSLANQVYTTILNRIQKGVIAQGERLNIEGLSEEFGVSRTPVREAIGKLTQEGFVEELYNSGPRVIQFENRQILEIIRANAILFDGVIESYADMSPEAYSELIVKLAGLTDSQRDAHLCDDFDRFYEASVQFHIVLIQYCANDVIKKYALQTQYQINMCALYYQNEKMQRNRSLEEHDTILSALKAQDYQQAAKLMKLHNKYAEDVFIEMIQAK